MIHIDSEKCKACGICAHVCPRHVTETIEREGEKVTLVSPERMDLCMGCGQCAAVCPNGSIQVDGLDFEEFAPLREVEIEENQLISLMEQRRSIRRYKDKPVPRDILDRIIEGAHRAPTGTSRRSTGVIIIDKPDILKNLSNHIFKLYESLDKTLNNPIARFFVKRRVGVKTLGTLEDFVMPGMRWYIRWYREKRGDEILRDCPALMLFHSPAMEPMCDTNCVIAAFHAIFMAEVLGIGTCFNDLIPPACNRVPEIRRLLDLPEEREVYASLTLGYPKYNFKRIIPRRLAEVRYLS
jgi:nitroreductase/NAD-dependent dihydropyrimidine dehydrogenase PreA subunit